MEGTSVHLTVSIPNDIANQTEKLKKELYLDKSYAEMYRDLIQLGIDTFKSEQLGKSPADHPE